MNKNITSYTHIIIGGDNINTLGVLRSLGEKEISPIIILYSEGHIKLVSKSKYAKNIQYACSIEQGFEMLKTYGNTTNKPFVYTTDDNTESLLDLHYNELINNFHFFNAGSSGRVTELMDKDNICKLAEENGFDVPDREVVLRGELPHKIKYPVITKTINPYSAGWKRDVGVYNNESQLKDAYKNMISEKLLLEEYINRKNEVAIQGISLNGGEKILLTYYSLMYRFTETAFGGYKYYQKLTDENLIKKVKNLIKQTKFSGIFEVEFMVKQDDTLSFLEVNFRVSASNYGMTFGNVNLPYLWSSSLIQGDFPQIQNLNLKNKRFSCLNEPRDFGQFVVSKRISIKKWIKDLIDTDSYYLFNKKDVGPALSFIFSKIKRKISKI